MKKLCLVAAVVSALSLTSSAQSYSVVKSFFPTYGSFPFTGVTLSSNILYGTCWQGGSSNQGTIYKINTDGSGFVLLKSFGDIDGAYPRSGLIVSSNTLYGTTSAGGGSGWGTVFKINTDGTGFTLLKEFTGGSDGSFPMATLTMSGDTLYGTTAGGGSSSMGTVFKVNIDGTGFAVLRSFSGTDGESPWGGLVLSGSTLFGTTYEGGSSGKGTVFAINTDGSGYVVLKNFAGSDGENPTATLTLSGTNLYGTTASGGSSGDGTVFAIGTNGVAFTLLKSFSGTNGNQPSGGALVISGTTLYGTTEKGSTYDVGTVFEINTDGTGFALLNTNALATGSYYAQYLNGLVLAGNTLYGTAQYGGIDEVGTVFKINTDGTGFDAISSFPFPEGEDIDTGLAVSGNTLYGTTYSGGASNLGTVFKINADGSGFTVLNSFSGNTAFPNSSLTVSGGTLYGTTGASSSWTLGVNGTVFKMNIDGTGFTVLKSFSEFAPYFDDSFYPNSKLVLSGTTLYCTTRGGGSSKAGTVFAIGIDGSSFTLLKSFAGGSDGATPSGDLVLTNGTVYGVTQSGGTSGSGTVFKINADGTGYALLKSFAGGSDGASPTSGLVLSGGTVYGTTASGGSTGNGTIFAINIDGSGFKQLRSFSSGDGAPRGNLTISGNMIFGMAQYYNQFDYNNIFRLNTDGTGFVVLKSSVGGSPNGMVLIGSTLFGTAEDYVAGVGGQIFSLKLAPTLTGQPSSQTSIVSTAATLSVSAEGDAPLSYQWQKNGTNIANATSSTLTFNPVSFVDAGTYSVVVTNMWGTTNWQATLSVICPNIKLGHLTDGYLGISYSQNIGASGGLAPYSYSVTNGVLPDGLSIDSNSGLLSGTPTVNGLYTFTATATDVNGCTGSSNYTVSVTCPTITVEPATLPNEVLGPYSQWKPTGSMASPRVGHTATLLPTGNVLITGGNTNFDSVNGGSSTTERTESYSPTVGVWKAAAAMATQRSHHTATLLNTGKLLVAGGEDGQGNVLSSAELYDANLDSWSATGNMNTGHSRYTATMLKDGTVLAAGGFNDQFETNSPFCEVYNPTTGLWTKVGSLSVARGFQTATLLNNGKVLVCGGADDQGNNLSSAEIYDPATSSWIATASMNSPRWQHTATLLPDGQVLVVGGEDANGNPLQRAELYDPTSGTWRTTGSLNAPRLAQAAVLLHSGKVLVAGGQGIGTRPALSEAELYDPATALWSNVGSLNSARIGPSATLLTDGTVLFAGGIQEYNPVDGNQSVTFLQSAEIYGLAGCSASGGTGPYTFSMTEGSFPNGLSLESDGSIDGVPLAIGTTTFTVMATDANGCTGSATYTLAIQPSGPASDITKPTVTVTSPPNKSAQNSSTIEILGTAHDSPGTAKSGVALVLYSLNGSSQQLAATANQFANWTASVTLQPGWNSFVAQAFDFRGNASAPISRTFLYGAAADVAGIYNGLFFETDDDGAPAIAEQSAGAVLGVAVQISGAYSGRIHLGGGNYLLKGVFDLSGNSTTSVTRGTPAPLNVSLHLDWTGAMKQMTGTVSCEAEGWSAPLLADLLVYNTKKNPHSLSRYTLAIPPGDDAPTASPGGYGYGVVSIGASGNITLTGALADSSAISQTVPVSKDGHWPLYVELYKHQGLLEGWVDLSSGAPTGEVTWIKPSNLVGVTQTTYLGGFTNEVNIFGSVYAAVVPAITPTDDLLTITDGSGLNLPLALSATVSANNTIVSLPNTTNALSGSVTKATGLVTVHFRPTGVGPITKTATGVVLQNRNAAYGAFIGNNDGTGKTNSGAIYLH